MHSDKRKAMWIIITLILFVTIVLLAMYFNFASFFMANDPSTLNVPEIKTVNTSIETGESGEVLIDVSLGGTNSVLENVKELDYNSIIKNTVQGIDYDIINSPEGISTIKKEVKNAINSNLSADNQIDDVYVSELYVGLTNTDEYTGSSGNGEYSSRKEQLETLFGGGK